MWCSAALAAGCRWVSMREKDLSEDDQVALAQTLLPIARRHGACLTLHGEAALAKASGSDGVHLPAGSDPVAARKLLGPAKLIGVSIHTVTEAEAIDRNVVDYAIAGPAFETPSKPGYGPEIGRKGLAEIARAAQVPILAIGGLNADARGGSAGGRSGRHRRHGRRHARNRSRAGGEGTVERARSGLTATIPTSVATPDPFDPATRQKR